MTGGGVTRSEVGWRVVGSGTRLSTPISFSASGINLGCPMDLIPLITRVTRRAHCSTSPLLVLGLCSSTTRAHDHG